jgi:1,4-alpha-glucan branching enzyme
VENRGQRPGLVNEEAWLEDVTHEILERQNRFNHALGEIIAEYGSLSEFANAHEYYGIHYDAIRKGWIYREWAPNAYQLFLAGDFNNWNRESHPLKRNYRNDWEIFLPQQDYKNQFVHQSKVKVIIHGENGAHDRIPSYIRRVSQDPESFDFAGQIWFPKKQFEWKDQQFDPSKNHQMPIIYECHVGMSQEKESVGTFREFADHILPYISQLGYNAIQMMAVMEHPYYGSFGYHVSNFFAPSSRFGTPEDLKYLINKSHQLGISVILDIIHSHAVKNLHEGLNEFDGSEDQYFHVGERGYHEGWDSKLFNYGKKEVLQFLLSNIKYWLSEFHFDGFRFDGVTSILYSHHGHVTFDHVDKYFKDGVDDDAVLFLQLANALIHEVNPNAISIAEEVSGMPGLCRPQQIGGIGFDFRLAMGIPDFWIETLKNYPDEQWDMYDMWHSISNRPKHEKTIAYAESHDQALVGDKTIAFWLMDKEMYFSMQKGQESLVVDRGIALHKMIRLISISLGGEGYLNFMGNEFGHPEWVDFPREGNQWSYQFARRQWSLAKNKDLKYHYLLDWDMAMLQIIKDNEVLQYNTTHQLFLHPDDKVLIFQRGDLIFAFNFHVSMSYEGLEFVTPTLGNYHHLINTDETKFGGFNRIDSRVSYPISENGSLKIYLPTRTALVLKRRNKIS